MPSTSTYFKFVPNSNPYSVYVYKTDTSSIPIDNGLLSSEILAISFFKS